MTYPLGAGAVLRRLRPVLRRRPLDVLEPGRDPHTPAQRAAIERKRSITEERDRRRFLASTARMADEEFATLPSNDNPLVAGLGRCRDTEMTLRWLQEPGRRARRTAHEVIAERRLYGLFGQHLPG